MPANQGDQSGINSLVAPTAQAPNSRPDPRLIGDGGAVFDTRDPGINPAQEISNARDKLVADFDQGHLVHEEMERLRAGQDLDNDGDDDSVPRIEVGEVNGRPAHCGCAANALTSNQNAAGLLPEAVEVELVDFVKVCFEMSHERISRRYDHWREAEQVHDLYVPASKLDEARKNRRGKPRIVDVVKTPYSRSISDTLCTYNLAIFGGMPPFRIEVGDRQAKRRAAKIIEAELANNMRRVGYERVLYQITLDGNRYGMAPVGLFYGDRGNVPMNIDPWGYFPDPRVTSQNRYEWEFCGVRSWASTSALRRRNMYDGVERLDSVGFRASWNCNQDMADVIRGQSVDQNQPNRFDAAPGSKWKLGQSHVLNTLYVYLEPQQFGINAPFGLYRITVANEKHIILFDRAPWPHGNIPIIHGEQGYDAHKTFSSGAYDLMMPLQRFQDWLLRARVENVQTMIQNRMIADPHKVVISDILNPNKARLIRTMPGVDPKTALQPIDVPDATKGYWSDLDTAGQLMQRLMAASDTAQGIQSDTERTATEIARLTALGQQRLGTQARLLSAGTIRPLVEMMIQNLQYFGVDGGQIRLPREFQSDDDGWYKWEHSEILGRFDYAVVDGTMPVDPRENANNLLRAMKTLADTGTASDWDMNKFIERVITSYGFEDVDNWKLDPATKEKRLKEMQKAKLAMDPQAQASMMNATAQMQNQVVPDEAIQQDVQAGNIVPLSQANQELGNTLPNPANAATGYGA